MQALQTATGIILSPGLSMVTILIRGARNRLYSDVQRADDIVLKSKGGQLSGNPQKHGQQGQMQFLL